MKVLVGAYACAPWLGSEPGAGWSWAEAASEHHDVWVLTSPDHETHIEACLEQYPALRKRLHPVYVALPRWAARPRPWCPDIARYLLWQRPARRAAKQLHAEVRFDVAHHVTWTVSWLPTAVSVLEGVPLVWGPVSGAVGVPRAMWRWLGWSGVLKELLRGAVIPGLRGVFARRPLRRASVVLAQSEDFAAWARRHTDAVVEVEPVVAFSSYDVGAIVTPARGEAQPQFKAVFAARFEAWKGLLPTIAALARPEAAEWDLDIYGRGSQELAARRLVTRLKLDDRVRFLGEVPRLTLDHAIAGAAALVHPSFHDAPPFVVAEALSLGCPVLCLDVGGPAALVAPGEGVMVSAVADLPGAIARGLQSLPRGLVPSVRWRRERLPELLDRWYAHAVDGSM